MLQATYEHIAQHYAEIKDRPYFAKVVKHVSSGPVVPMVTTEFVHCL